MPSQWQLSLWCYFYCPTLSSFPGGCRWQKEGLCLIQASISSKYYFSYPFWVAPALFPPEHCVDLLSSCVSFHAPFLVSSPFGEGQLQFSPKEVIPVDVLMCKDRSLSSRQNSRRVGWGGTLNRISIIPT